MAEKNQSSVRLCDAEAAISLVAPSRAALGAGFQPGARRGTAAVTGRALFVEVQFDGDLGDIPAPEWSDHIDQVLMAGNHVKIQPSLS